jgi:hypothetical protein
VRRDCCFQAATHFYCVGAAEQLVASCRTMHQRTSECKRYLLRCGHERFRKTWSLAGLAAQVYADWTLIAIGDGLWANEIAHFFQALDDEHIPRHKVVFRNMDLKLREVNLYNNVPFANGSSIWTFAGANAVNLGLDIAAALRHELCLLC